MYTYAYGPRAINGQSQQIAYYLVPLAHQPTANISHSTTISTPNANGFHPTTPCANISHSSTSHGIHSTTPSGNIATQNENSFHPTAPTADISHSSITHGLNPTTFGDNTGVTTQNSNGSHPTTPSINIGSVSTQNLNGFHPTAPTADISHSSIPNSFSNAPNIYQSNTPYVYAPAPLSYPYSMNGQQSLPIMPQQFISQQQYTFVPSI